MPRMEFEPTIPVFEWAKTVHALHRAATVIGKILLLLGLELRNPGRRVSNQTLSRLICVPYAVLTAKGVTITRNEYSHF
jgi:hypothetical protein